MQTNGPLDVSGYVDDDVNEEYELEITEKDGAPFDSRRKVEVPRPFEHLSHFDLEEEIKKHHCYLRDLPLKDTRPMERKIKAYENEKRIRKEKEQEKSNLEPRLAGRGFSVNGGVNGGRPRTTRSSFRSISDLHSKTDCSGRTSKGDETNGRAFSDEVEIMNPPLKQRSPNTQGSALDGVKDTSRVFSGTQAGPVPRTGLRSSSKLCSECSGAISDFVCGPCSSDRFYGKKLKRSSAIESPKRISPPGPAMRRKGNGVNKRARQGAVCTDNSETIVELMSSEDEGVKETQDTFADCQIASQKRGYGTRSSLLPSMEGVRIAYPCGDDPEAVEVLYQDLHRLEPLEFLNDTVIDFYIKYIQRPENLSVEDKNKFHFFNSFFYKKLSEIVSGQNKKAVADLSKLRKWTRGTNIFEREYLFVPIHDKWHWSLAIVCHPGAASDDTGSQRCILHLDSMSPGHKSNSVFKLLRTYLVAEWEHQAANDSVEKLRPEDLTTQKIPVPQQENESDCGLFLLHYIEVFIKEAPASFRLCDVDQGRLFGLHWFEPQQASALRRNLKELLEDLFKAADASRATENAEIIESSSLQQDLDGSGKENDTLHGDSSAEGIERESSPGQPSATELLNRHGTPAACVPNVDLSSRVSTPEAIQVDGAQQHLGDGLVGIDEEDSRACSQASGVDPSRPNELPPGSMLESSGELELSAGSKLLLEGPADDTDTKVLTSGLGGHIQSGIPLVVDLTIQGEQLSAE